jgi:hypothetical protein
LSGASDRALSVFIDAFRRIITAKPSGPVFLLSYPNSTRRVLSCLGQAPTLSGGYDPSYKKDILEPKPRNTKLAANAVGSLVGPPELELVERLTPLSYPLRRIEPRHPSELAVWNPGHTRPSRVTRDRYPTFTKPFSDFKS